MSSYELRQNKVFANYGKYYDLIYLDKDYDRECDFLEEIFSKFSEKRPNRILDVGCGTGGHALRLAKRGYDVIGIDFSKSMIRIANDKARERDVLYKKPDFVVMDARYLGFVNHFDACIAMFAVVSYITSNRDLLLFFRETRHLLRENSLFIFDFWYGPAVLIVKPSERIKSIRDGDLTVIRIAKPELDILNHVCKVRYSLLILKGNMLIDEVFEEHVVRYFFPQEILHYLEENNFELLELCPFLRLGEKVTEKDWSVTAIARAV